MITVRRASLKDGRAVSELLKQKYSFVSLKQARKTFAFEFVHNHHFRIAEIDGRIVGLVSWRPQGILKHGVVELTRIAIEIGVSNARQVKEALFDVMVAEADFYYKKQGYRLRKVFSLIHADDKVIKEFFIDKGMQQEAVLKNHFYRGKDELVFSLFLA